MNKTISLDNIATRVQLLEAIHACGVFGDAYKILGISKSKAARYREKHPDFDFLCNEAKRLHFVEKQILYRATIKEVAMARIKQRLKDDTLSESGLFRLAGIP